MTKLEKVQTRDGSFTYRNLDVDETYHTMSGALQEAREKHVEPSEIAKLDEVVLLDVCFGLGYNTMAALDACKGKDMQVFAFENDREILDKINDIDFGEMEPYANIIRELLKNEIEPNLYVYVDDTVSITLYLGDVRQTIKNIATEVANAVFFDPFSPKKQPELWTAEFMSEVVRTMRRNALLTTYSCAKSARSAMVDAGLEPFDGPSVGRTSPSTIARKL